MKMKNKITFTYEYEGMDEIPPTKVIYEVDADTSLYNLLESFKNFALACTFSSETVEKIQWEEEEC